MDLANEVAIDIKSLITSVALVNSTLSQKFNNSIATNTLLGRVTAGTGVVEQLSNAQVKTFLGTTTVGNNLLTLPNPGAVSFIRVDAANTITLLTAAQTRTALSAGTVTSITVTQPAAGITISGSGTPATTIGSYTFSLSDDLAAVEGITTTGIVKRTAANTWTAETIKTVDLDPNIITNAKLAQIATATVKARTTAGSGDVEDISFPNFKIALSLNNVDNTSDVNKPISTSTQTALDGKLSNGLGTLLPKYFYSFNQFGNIWPDSGMEDVGFYTGTFTLDFTSSLYRGRRHLNINATGGSSAKETVSQWIPCMGDVTYAIWLALGTSDPDTTANMYVEYGTLLSSTATIAPTRRVLLATNSISNNPAKVRNDISPLISLSERMFRIVFERAAGGTGSTAYSVSSIHYQAQLNEITNAKLADMATQTFKGRVTAGTGDPEDLTVAQVKTLLAIDQINNISDANKPISTATQTALDGKLSNGQNQVLPFNLLAQDGSNLIPDPLAVDSRNWVAEGIWAAGWSALGNAQTSGLRGIRFNGVFTDTSGVSNTGGYYSTSFPVEAGRPYALGGFSDSTTGTTGKFRLVIQWFDRLGALVETTVTERVDLSTPVTRIPFDTVIFTPSSIVTSARFGVQRLPLVNGGDSTATSIDAIACFVRRATDTDLLVNKSVTNAKLADMLESTIKGRATGTGTGVPEDLTATQIRTLLNVASGATANSSDATLLARTNHTGTQIAATISDFSSAVAATAAVTANTAKVSNATHTGDVTGSTVLTISNSVVSNAKLANVATATIKGRTTAGTGDVEDISFPNFKTALSLNNVENTTDANKPISSATQTALNNKQATLVSGTNIRTINGSSILGSTDLVVRGSRVFSFGGTGTPTAGTDKTPWVAFHTKSTILKIRLMAKTAPSGGSFTVSVRSGDGTTFSLVQTISLTTGVKTNTATLTTTLLEGVILRLDIDAVNGAADWTCQVETVETV